MDPNQNNGATDPGKTGNADPALDKTVNNPANANPNPVDTSQNWRSALDVKDVEYLTNKGFVYEGSTPEEAIKGLTKSYSELEKTMGADKATIARIPGKEATQEEKNAFYDKLGRPSEASKYDFKLPEGAKTDAEMVEWYKGAAHTHGLTNEQANAVINDYLQFETQKMGEYNDALKAVDAQDTQTLQKDWGKDYDKNIELARRGGMAQGWTAEQLDSMANTIGKAALYKGILSFGKAKAEDNRLESGGVVNGQRYTPESAKARLTQLEGDRAFGDRYRANDAAAVAEFKELNDIAHGTDPINRVGA